jgi:DNA-binding beta-propeller fold protein YncE
MNHTIRRVDLASRTVTTVAGIGERILTQADEGPALDSRLNYPWDIVYVDGLVYIAMAGQHQIWIYDPAREWVAPFAGSGTEEMRDGPLLVAGLNQPMALTTDGSVLYVADSEGSAIREADLDPSGNVCTIVGLDFYVFGDVDGTGDQVRMQRPVGIAYQDGLLYVADTYNSKIKTVDPETRRASTFLGTSEAGWRDGTEPLFYDPSGLSIAVDKLYVADTNNHVIRVVDLVTREVSTLVLVDPKGLLE